jgi:hypothetical protein
LKNKPDDTELKALELNACTPHPINIDGFNHNALLPHKCSIESIKKSMSDFIDFIGFVNQQLNTKQMPRLESMLMAANFSSVVGEFMISNIPKYCTGLVKNRHHNGHPDLVPKGYYPDDDILHGDQGIEIKASRYLSGWQGHNREACWLMVFVFGCNSPDKTESSSADMESISKVTSLATSKSKLFIEPKPFRFVKVVGAQLTEDDWSFSGRSATSRRTITSSVVRSGYEKMMSNWIYQDLPPS